MKPYSVDIVVPCYHEAEALPVTGPKIIAYLEGLQTDEAIRMATWRLILVDDGSKDDTWRIISEMARDDRVLGVKLSRNYGHQSAMIAGLSQADADAVITMDADLQDDITTLRTMLLEYQAGSDLVLGVRSSREADTSFKRNTAQQYYQLLRVLGVKIIPDHADYRLTSRRALKSLLAHEEVNLFLRGIIPTIGFKTALVPYVRQARELGETKYTLRKMIGLAINGITSFSIMPLRMIAVLGLFLFLLSIAAGIWVLTMRFFSSGYVVPGWASTVLPILALGGGQILSIGILGEYIGKIYLEVKRRPRFIIEQTTS